MRQLLDDPEKYSLITQRKQMIAQFRKSQGFSNDYIFN
ncbi:hypothetical protein IMCC1989_2163 [gamma proteobacterium IMCC1989]|nr:hypothetical protein IMCC1989_2163 [gamma proteobacterium IMCC1989]